VSSFRTKRGRCVIEDDTLALESSLRGQLARYREGNRLLYWCYVGILLALVGWVGSRLLFGFDQRDLLTVGVIVGLLALARGIAWTRGFTSADTIPVSAIDRVNAIDGAKGVTRPRFIVHYERDGDEKKRYVMMASRFLSYGDDEFETAIAVFREHDIPVVEDVDADVTDVADERDDT